MLARAYSESLTDEEQKALGVGADTLINACFEELSIWNNSLEYFQNSIFADYLPQRYSIKYTPLFLKQFTVCIITVSWKLAQSQPLRLASLAEEIAAWAILSKAREFLEDEEDESAFNPFIDTYFEDTDFLYLFDDKYDGIDETELKGVLGMESLKFADWFKPYRDGDDINDTIHPYTEPDDETTEE